MSVILLDEFEKANPGCWDVFLQMFDAGRLTDGQGATVDFSNAIVIMTSNVGSELFAQDGPHVGFSGNEQGRSDANFNEISDQIQEKLKKVFRPEFLNRVDEIIVFRPLEKPSLVKIASLMLKKAPVLFQADEEVLEYLATQGYEPQYGARHLRRAIQDLVLEPLASLMIDGKFKNGDTVRLEFNGEKILFELGK
jgi:ATP-dependent Clp protease ATP-binding subunit ClpC